MHTRTHRDAHGDTSPEPLRSGEALVGTRSAAAASLATKLGFGGFGFGLGF